MPCGIAKKTDGKMILAWRSVTKRDLKRQELLCSNFGIKRRTLQVWASKVRYDPDLLTVAKDFHKEVDPNDNNISKRNKRRGRKKMPAGKPRVTDGKAILAWRVWKGGNEDEIVALAKRFEVKPVTIRNWATRVTRSNQKLLAYAQSSKPVDPKADNISDRPKLNSVQKKRKKSKSVKKTSKGKPKTFSGKHLMYTAKLEDELAFMKWWNTGERNGYVERLLKALQQD